MTRPDPSTPSGLQWALVSDAPLTWSLRRNGWTLARVLDVASSEHWMVVTSMARAPGLAERLQVLSLASTCPLAAVAEAVVEALRETEPGWQRAPTREERAMGVMRR